MLSFNTLLPQLKPLSIIGLNYNWSLDLVGLFIVTSRRTKHILMIIEHFRKWIKVKDLPQNSSKLVAIAFIIVY